jgi:outer membrane protein assembly factor BamB
VNQRARYETGHRARRIIRTVKNTRIFETFVKRRALGSALLVAFAGCSYSETSDPAERSTERGAVTEQTAPATSQSRASDRPTRTESTPVPAPAFVERETTVRLDANRYRWRADTVPVDTPFTVTTTVQNRGGAGELTVELTEGSTTVATETKRVDGGTEATYSFAYRPETTGTVAVSAGGEVLRELSVAEPATDWPRVGFDTTYSGHNRRTTGPTSEGSVRWTLESTYQMRHSPVVYGDSVLVPERLTESSLADPPTGRLYRLDRATGDVVWSRETPSRINSPVTVVDDTAYAKTTDRLLALDIDDGSVEWAQSGGLSQASDGGDPGRNAPVVHDGHVYVNSVRYTESDAKAMTHQFEVGSGDPGFAVETNSFRPPVPTEDGLIVLGQRELRSVVSGSVEWRVDLGMRGGVFSPVTVDDGRAYLCSAQTGRYSSAGGGGEERRTTHVFCVDQSGEVAWRHELDGENLDLSVAGSSTTPVVDGDLVHVPDRQGFVYSFDKVTGERVHTLNTFEQTPAPVYADVAMAGNVVYLPTSDGRILGCAPLDDAVFPVWSPPEDDREPFRGDNTIAVAGDLVVATKFDRTVAIEPDG